MHMRVHTQHQCLRIVPYTPLPSPQPRSSTPQHLPVSSLSISPHLHQHRPGQHHNAPARPSAERADQAQANPIRPRDFFGHYRSERWSQDPKGLVRPCRAPPAHGRQPSETAPSAHVGTQLRRAALAPPDRGVNFRLVYNADARADKRPLPRTHWPTVYLKEVAVPGTLLQQMHTLQEVHLW